VTPNEIIEANLETARKIAARFTEQCSPNDHDEILSAAYFGLVKAAQVQSPNKAYINLRIAGEIKDAIRQNDTLYRVDRAIMQAVEACEGNIYLAAESLGYTPEYVHKRLTFIRDTTIMQPPDSTLAPTPCNVDEILEVCRNVLPENLHVYFTLYYKNQMSYTQIAEHLGDPIVKVYRRVAKARRMLQMNREELAEILF
jgi:RNA polymerase sigma factor (sigma-70 family)